jgi:hypothetical protein
MWYINYPKEAIQPNPKEEGKKRIKREMIKEERRKGQKQHIKNKQNHKNSPAPLPHPPTTPQPVQPNFPFSSSFSPSPHPPLAPPLVYNTPPGT